MTSHLRVVPPAPPTKPLTISLPDALLLQLQDVAARRGWTIQQAVTVAIASGLLAADDPRTPVPVRIIRRPAWLEMVIGGAP